MAQKITGEDGVIWEVVKINTDIIDIYGIPLFDEVSLQNNPSLTQKDLEFLIDQRRQMIIDKVGTAFFRGQVSEEFLAFLIIKLPQLKRCIIRIGADRVWLPRRGVVYFKGDPRLN